MIRYSSPQMQSRSGTFSLLCVRRRQFASRISVYPGALEVASFQDRDLLWFASASRAVIAAQEIVASAPFALNAAVSTGDTESERSIQRMFDEASGAADLAEAGEVIVSLSTQEICRYDLPDDLAFVKIGPQVLGTGAKSLLFMLTKRSELRETSHYGGARPWNLGEFVGRKSELDQLRDTFQFSRFVVLSGPTGIGKSMLSWRYSTEAQESQFEDTLWVDLQEVYRPSLMLHKVAAALEITSLNEANLFEQIANEIGERDLLVVLDGCDWIIEEAVKFVEQLLERCLNSSFLVTSPKRVSSGATFIELEGLGVPSKFENPEFLLEFDSVRYLLDLAAKAGHEVDLSDAGRRALALVAIAVEGSPLALKMVASRLGILTPKQILNRLKDDPLGFLIDKDRPAGSIDAALRAAVSTLNPWSTRLFHRLWIFEGSFDAEALEAVCSDARVPPMAVLDSLKDLSEAYLVHPSRRGSSTRCFRLNQITKDFSRRGAKAREVAMLKANLARYLEGKEQRFWQRSLNSEADAIEEFDRSYEDLRRRWINQSRSEEGAEQAIDAVLKTANFWLQKLDLAEGWATIKPLTDCPTVSKAPNYASLLNAGAWFALKLSAFEESEALLRKAIGVAYRSSQEVEIAKILTTASALFDATERSRSAIRCSRLAMKQFEKVGLSNQVNISRSNLAGLLVSVEKYEEALELVGQLEPPEFGRSWADVSYYNNRANIKACKGEIQGAISDLRRACDLSQSFPYVALIPSIYLTACEVALRSGRMVDLGELLASANDAMSHYGLPQSPKCNRLLEKFAQSVCEFPPCPASNWSSLNPLEILDKFLNNW